MPPVSWSYSGNNRCRECNFLLAARFTARACIFHHVCPRICLSPLDSAIPLLSPLPLYFCGWPLSPAPPLVVVVRISSPPPGTVVVSLSHAAVMCPSEAAVAAEKSEKILAAEKAEDSSSKEGLEAASSEDAEGKQEEAGEKGPDASEEGPGEEAETDGGLWRLCCFRFKSVNSI